MSDRYDGRYGDRYDGAGDGYRDDPRYGGGYGYDGPSSDGMSSSSAAGGYARTNDVSAYSRSSYAGRRSTSEASGAWQDTRISRRYSRSNSDSLDSLDRQSRRQVSNGGEERASRRSTARQSTRSRGETDRMDAVEYDESVAPTSRMASRDTTTRESFSRSSESYASRRPGGGRRKGPIIAGVIVALLIVGAIGAFAYINNVTGRLHAGVDQNLRDALVQTDMGKEPFYMLLLGTDKSAVRDDDEEFGGVYRTDSMMLARIDPVNRKVTLVSIPRDTLVNLGEDGYQRVNAAYAFGGPAEAVSAVSDLAGVDISHYAEIDFDGFEAIVDALGGVEVDVPIEIDDWEAGGYVPAGLQTLNGEQALVVCRARAAYADVSAAPDLMRAANQRLVLSAIAHKLLESDVATIANTVTSVADYVTTDLELNDIVGLAQIMQGLDSGNDMYTASFPTESRYIANGYTYLDAVSFQVTGTIDSSIEAGYYLLPDEKEWNKMKGRMEEGLPPSEGAMIDEATGTVMATAGADAKDVSEKNCSITVKNTTDIKGAATRTTEALKKAGFTNTVIGEAAEGFDYPETLVVYDEETRQREAQQIVDVMGQGKALLNNGSYLMDTDFLIIIGADWKTGE